MPTEVERPTETPPVKSSDFVLVQEYRKGDLAVRFWPLGKGALPGFSHRVQVVQNGGKLVGQDWLGSNAHPSAKTAAFFYEKIVNKRVAW